MARPIRLGFLRLAQPRGATRLGEADLDRSSALFTPGRPHVLGIPGRIAGNRLRKPQRRCSARGDRFQRLRDTTGRQGRRGASTGPPRIAAGGVCFSTRGGRLERLRDHGPAGPPRSIRRSTERRGCRLAVPARSASPCPAKTAPGTSRPNRLRLSAPRNSSPGNALFRSSRVSHPGRRMACRFPARSAGEPVSRGVRCSSADGDQRPGRLRDTRGFATRRFGDTICGQAVGDTTGWRGRRGASAVRHAAQTPPRRPCRIRAASPAKATPVTAR